MKNINKIFIGLVLVATTSCSDLAELNQDPTKATGNIDPSLLIPTIQMSHSLGRQNAARFFAYPGAWTNHWAGSWGPMEYGGRGIKSPEYYARLWQDQLFPEAVRNIVALEELSKNNPDRVNFSAIAKVLRVETFLKLTDAYGDVPYTEAGQAYYKRIFSPKYDKQEDIYNDFFRILTQAIGEFNTAAKSPKEDLYYAGNVEKWKKLAASLKLRVAMRLIKVNQTLATEMAKEAFNAGIMTSNDDIAAVKHGEDYETLGAGNGYADIMLQATNTVGLGISQYKLTTEFFKALCVMDNNQYTTPPYRRYVALDPRLLLIAETSITKSGAGVDAWKDAVEVTELMRKYNAGASNQQGPIDLATTVDGYINIGGYLTLPAQEFGYGGGIQRVGENGYAGAEKARSVWANGITSANIEAATWLNADEKKVLTGVIGTYTVPHNMYRLTPSRYILNVSSPWIHLSYAETQFLMAETTIRGWNIDTETAVTRFKNGYKAAVKQFSLFDVKSTAMPSDSQIDAYLDTYLVPHIQAGGTEALEEISKQIWILNFMDPFEAWANMRRTNGMPTAHTKWYNREPSRTQSNGLAPRRLQYPIAEQNKNEVNWKEAIGRIGGSDDWTKPVWWDVN